MNPLVTSLVVAPAALWGWYVLAWLHPPFGLSRLRDRLERIRFFRDLFGCPWCTGLWLAAIGVVWIHTVTGGGWWYAPVETLAAAGIVGTVGTLLPDTGDVVPDFGGE